MLPDDEGNIVETHRPDVKGRWDFWIDRPDFLLPYALIDRVLVGFYQPGDHFTWHRDDMLPTTENRDLAVTVALNDPSEYEGGFLELPEFGLTLRPPRGAAVFFPASALHRVTPVTSGVRKVLLTFVLKDVPT